MIKSKYLTNEQSKISHLSARSVAPETLGPPQDLLEDVSRVRQGRRAKADAEATAHSADHPADHHDQQHQEDGYRHNLDDDGDLVSLLLLLAQLHPQPLQNNPQQPSLSPLPCKDFVRTVEII